MSQLQQWRPQTATVVLLLIVLGAGAIAAAWFAGNGTINEIFAHLRWLQENPPLWLQAPMVAGETLVFWTLGLMLLAYGITLISPRPQTWSCLAVVSILLVLLVRYLLWRVLSTLNLSDPLNGVFSLGLLALELLMLSTSLIQLSLMMMSRDRKRQADQLAQAVVEHRYRPPVDVLIPSYDEPEFILRRTIIGCQAMDYEPKTIYLLDDTRRPEIRELAAELGCEYRTRLDNRHAKAGNLNHTIPHTHGELIVVFDADFIPTCNFLTRTVGFFQDPNVALVQTPQSFYNPDPIARNLGLENLLTPEEEVFYRQIQRIKDGAGSVVCAGTSFVVRRAALVQAGCFVTDSLSEDYFTGIQLASKGYQLVYLNEKLSAGLAAESIADHALQRIRWAQGTLQAFFIKSNPLTIPGLDPIQRLAHFEGLLHWFTSLSRVGFLLMPLAYSFLGVIPLQTTGLELLYYLLPFYLVNITVFSWLNFHSRSAILSDLYSIVLAFPLASTAIQSLLRPFGKGFKVTPKGGLQNRFRFNWQLAWPLVTLFVLTAISLWINLGWYLQVGMGASALPLEVSRQVEGVGVGWIWSAYNLFMLAVVLLILLDVPRSSARDWYDLQRTVKLTVGHHSFWGTTTMVSELGADIALTQQDPSLLQPDIPISLELLELGLRLQAHITHLRQPEDELPIVRVGFAPLNLAQQRQLVELLYCRPGQWRSRCAPGELHSIWLLFKVLLQPQVLFNRAGTIRPLAVAKG